MLECPHNTYKDYIGFASSCKPCPVNSGHNLLGSHIFSDCKCLKGYSGDPMQDIPCTSKKEVCSLLTLTFILSVVPHIYIFAPLIATFQFHHLITTLLLLHHKIIIIAVTCFRLFPPCLLNLKERITFYIRFVYRGVYLTIIPRVRVGYEMIDSQRGT